MIHKIFRHGLSRAMSPCCRCPLSARPATPSRRSCNAVRRTELWTDGAGRLRKRRSRCRLILWNPQQRRTAMKYYCGLDVSLNSTAACVVNQDGTIIRESELLSEPTAIDQWLKDLGLPMERVGSGSRRAVIVVMSRTACCQVACDLHRDPACQGGDECAAGEDRP
jgi:hypothetical protein